MRRRDWKSSQRADRLVLWRQVYRRSERIANGLDRPTIVLIARCRISRCVKHLIEERTMRCRLLLRLVSRARRRQRRRRRRLRRWCQRYLLRLCSAPSRARVALCLGRGTKTDRKHDAQHERYEKAAEHVPTPHSLQVQSHWVRHGSAVAGTHSDGRDALKWMLAPIHSTGNVFLSCARLHRRSCISELGRNPNASYRARPSSLERNRSVAQPRPRAQRMARSIRWRPIPRRRHIGFT